MVGKRVGSGIVDAVNACLEQIAQRQGQINAFSFLRPRAEIIAEAAAAEERWRLGKQRSPIDGMSIGIKANICTRQYPTTCGSAFLSEEASPIDATVVALLQRAGVIVMGKTNMDEFGMGSFNLHSIHGPTYNPLSFQNSGSVAPTDNDQLFVAGGSSGGSAAAVAANFCQAALGSDTGGSVRLPAAYCGTFGFKPSYGRFSRWGLVAYASSFDTIGILGKCPFEMQDIFDVMSRNDPLDSTSVEFPPSHYDGHVSDPSKERPLQGLKFGVPKEYFISGLSDAMLKAWNTGIEELERLGASAVSVSLPNTQHALQSYYVIAPAEASSNLSKFDGVRFGKSCNNDEIRIDSQLFAKTRNAGFGDEVKRRIVLGTYVLQANEYTSYFLRAQSIRSLIKQDFDNVFSFQRNGSPNTRTTTTTVDFLLTPASFSSAPSLDQVHSNPLMEYINDAMTVPASLAGLPAMVMPSSTMDTHFQRQMPLGLQLIAQYGSDSILFRIAAAMRFIKSSSRGFKKMK